MTAAADDPQGARQAEATPQLRRRDRDAAAPGTRRGAHRRDLNKDGNDEDDAAIDADGRLVAAAASQAEFQPALGEQGLRRAARDARDSATYTGGAPDAPGLLRRLVGLRLQGPARPVRPDGRRAPGAASTAAAARSRSCRQALQASLRAGAEGRPRSSSTAHGDCAADPQPTCFDQNRSTVTVGDLGAAVPVPEPPDVPAGGELTQRLPR